MAPTIGRQWRGGTQDYAALCDYCDVRYLRSQLKKQHNGRLACTGPGTNGCGAGHDEVGLDKKNADRLRHRRRPEKHRGGRFDRLRASVEDIFGSTLQDYWDATKNVVAASDGFLTSWTSVKLGASLVPLDPGFRAHWHASVPELSNRPAVEVLHSTFGQATFTADAPFLPAGARPYVGLVQSIRDSTIAFGVEFGRSATAIDAAIYPYLYDVTGYYESVAGLVSVSLLRAAVGSVKSGYLYQLDATGPFVFHAGKASGQGSQDSPNKNPWSHVSLYAGAPLTLLVVANGPTKSQIAEFAALGTSYAVRLP